LFGVVVSTQEAIESILKAELFLFHRFHVENVDFLDPLMWWVAMSLGFQMWVFWHDKLWASEVHRLRLNGSSQLQVCSLVCDDVVLELRIFTSLS
jgi:hypothetical protein